jgi:hypothetical protein
LVQRGELAQRLLFRRLGQLLDARRHAIILAVWFHQELPRCNDYLEAFTSARGNVTAAERGRKALTYAAYNFVIL